MLTVSTDALCELERLLHAEIPLTRAMGVTVAHFDTTGLTLRAPLEPNINHKSTAFGGSLATLATLAGWGLLKLVLREQSPVTVVIQESRVRYLLPVTHDFSATVLPPAPGDIEKFLAQLKRHGVARIDLAATIPAGDRVAVHFEGRFVAFDKRHYPAAGNQ